MIDRSLRHIHHIIKSIDVVNDFLAECSEAEFGNNRMLYDAVLYNLQTMSESTTRLPKEWKDRHNNIQWADIAGFRNIIVHEYLGDIDPEIIWGIIVDKLPALKQAMLDMLDEYARHQ